MCQNAEKINSETENSRKMRNAEILISPKENKITENVYFQNLKKNEF